MNTALYARVSTSDGRQTAENQLHVLRERAGAGAREYVDYASGAKSNRVELSRLLADAEAGEIQVLWIWALDRLTREGISAMLNYLDRLRKAGCRVLSVQESWLDTDGPLSELLVAILSWVAKQERIRIGERVRAGLVRARSEGKVLGRPPIHTSWSPKRLRACGSTVREISERTGIPRSTVGNMLQKGKK